MMRFYAQAAQGMTSAAPATFDKAPTLANDRGETVPGLVGWQFTNGPKKRILLINQTAQPQTIAAASLGTNFRQYHAPLATYVQGTESLQQRNGQPGQTLVLAPYSLTIID